MTEPEKIESMKVAIAPDTAEDAVLLSEIQAAESMILNKMYPFGYPEDAQVPTRYERLQIRLAVELYTQRGAEGQASHTENGTTRTWPSVNRILAQIIPHCGSVIYNEERTAKLAIYTLR
jgi:hypothetical protein